MKPTLQKILDDISDERTRQYKKWGPQSHDLPTWIAILSEEVGELSKEVLTEKFNGGVRSENLYTEAIQVAAVATAIAQYIKDGEA